MAHGRRISRGVVVNEVAGSAVRVRRPEWVAHVLDEAAEPPRAVLLHLPSGRRIGLSDTATTVWREIVASGAAGVEAAEVARTVAPEYGVEPVDIVGDIADLYDQLLQGEWVEAVAARAE